MEEARCGAILDEAIEELLTEVVKKEVSELALYQHIKLWEWERLLELPMNKWKLITKDF